MRAGRLQVILILILLSGFQPSSHLWYTLDVRSRGATSLALDASDFWWMLLPLVTSLLLFLRVRWALMVARAAAFAIAVRFAPEVLICVIMEWELSTRLVCISYVLIPLICLGMLIFSRPVVKFCSLR
jgi:hypothetical protein